MTTATPLMTIVKDDGGVTQTTYELSEPVTFMQWTGLETTTKHVIVSHARYDEIDETGVFTGTPDGKIDSYVGLYMYAPACDDASALEAIGLTPAPVSTP